MPEILLETIHKPIGTFPYIELFNPNLNSMPHFHEEIEIAFVENGIIQAFSGEKTLTLSKGDVCIFMPGEIHGFNTLINTENNVRIIKFNINSYIENYNFEKIRLRNNTISKADKNYESLKYLIDTLSLEYKDKNNGYEFAIRSYKNQIIAYILRNIDYFIIDTSKNTHLLNTVILYIEKNYTNKIRLTDIAAECHFSHFYFAHEFKRISGTTFVNYLTDYRLEKSIELLKKTGITITDIAIKCGFENLRSFDRSFILKYNDSPMNFRKKHTSNSNK